MGHGARAVDSSPAGRQARHLSLHFTSPGFAPVSRAPLKDTGLGIGIDFGATRLVQMAGGLSVVGAPVVYACRLG
jgi:hypothetical protein